MKFLLVALAAACFLSIASATAPLLNMGSASKVPDQYIVVFHEHSTVEERDRHVHDLTTRMNGNEKIIGKFDIGKLIGYSAVLSKDNLANELVHPNVRYIEADQIATLVDSTTTQTTSAATWGITRVGQRNLPLGNSYTYFSSAGTGVWAYIIDTGILTTHNDFGGRAIQGTSTVAGEGNNDGNGHGTHVASTVGGTTYGVAKNVKLVAVKVLGTSGSGTWAGVLQGVDWATKNHTSRGQKALSVANMSLGGAATATLDAAIEESIKAGLHYAIAAGNDNANACNYSPARVPDAITVGATANTDARASFSNYGKCLDVFAPGQAITAAYINNPVNSGTQSLSGTSMASPHVCGVMAVRLGHLSNTGSGTFPTPQQMSAWLTESATPGKVTNAGTGSPNYLLYSPSA